MKLLAFILLLMNITIGHANNPMSITIQQAKDKHQQSLMALPGVVSIGIGLSGEEKVIIVGLDGKHPDVEKSIPQQLDGYRVIHQLVGEIKVK